MELDGIRGLAILMVMLHHMTLLDPASVGNRWLMERAEMGSAGVDLFFVLSGFLITGILLDAKGARHFFRNFYVRRVLRIFPLYYAVVAFSLLVLPRIPNPKSGNFGRVAGDEMWYWLHLSNFAIAAHNAFRHAILDISWSLSIEEQFYLLWPAIVFFLARRNLKRLSAGLIVAAPVARAIAVASGAGWVAVYVLTPYRVDALAYGALVALVLREPGGLGRWRSRAAWLAAASCLVWLGFGLTSPAYRENPVAEVAVYSAVGVLFASLLVLVLTASETSALRRLFRQRALVVLGLYSYALYLFHLPLRAVVRDVLFRPSDLPSLFGMSLPGLVLFYALSIAVSLAAALASWHLYEKWFLRLKDRFTSRRLPDAPVEGGIEGDPTEAPERLAAS